VTLGQFGSSSDSARNNGTDTTFSIGGNLVASERVTLALDVTFSMWEESLDQVDLSAPHDILEKLHWSSYDLSRLHTYSDLDATSWDATLSAEARLGARTYGTLSYSYFDYQDDAPYLADLGGNIDYVRLGLRWAF